MRTQTKETTTGERTAARGNSKEQMDANNALMLKIDREREARRTAAHVSWPTHADIQRMAGFPEDREGFAIVDEEDDDSPIKGLPSDESASYNSRDEGRSDGHGESYAERNT